MATDDDFDLYETEADKVKAATAAASAAAADIDGGDNSTHVAGAQLRAYLERIERMEEEKASIAADIREIYAEAKGNGFDTKIVRAVVKIRKQDANEREEQRALTELYLSAIGLN